MVGQFPSDWYLTTYSALFDLWVGFLVFLPRLVGSLVVFIVGWLLSSGMGKLLEEVLRKMRFNKIFDRTGWSTAFKKADLDVDAAEFLGMIAKWILVIVFLLASVEILGFLQFAVFLTKVLAFVPSVIVSVLMFVVAVIMADLLQKVVVASIARAGVRYSRLAGLIVRWAILGFALLAVLVQLGIAKEMVLTLFTGLVGMLTLSFGLAFGLGGKSVAEDMLKNLRRKLK